MDRSGVLDLYAECVHESLIQKYMRKLDEAEQNMVLEMVRNFVRLKQRKIDQPWQAENE